MSIGFAYNTHDSFPVGYLFRGYWPPVSYVPEIGISPIDGTQAYRDYPGFTELDVDPSRL